MTRQTTVRAASDWLIISLFSTLICVPLVLALTGPGQDYSSEEKRFLAEFPKFGSPGQGFTVLARDIDRYYQDHFGLREFFIHRYHREVNKRFAAASAPDVLTGKDGWLFYTGERVLEDLMGRIPLSREQLAQLAARVGDTRAWLAAKGISYLALVAPDKQSIYPEYLPDFYQNAKGATRLDQAVAALNRDPATAILDLRPVLLRNKEQRLYDKTDTHWNQLGAYCGSREILRAVAERFPGEDFQTDFSVGALWRQDPAGDLAQLSGRGETLSEMRPEMFALLRAKEIELSPSLREILKLKQLDPYYTKRQGRKLRVLVLHDSFMNPMKPFLSESFGEVLYIWKYFDRNIENFLSREVMDKVLAEYQPDLVIDQVVERHLDWLLREEGSGIVSASAGAEGTSY